MKTVVLVLALASTLACADTIGVHLESVHVPHSADLHNFNPGVYWKGESGATVGAYHNSLGRWSVYGGWTIEQESGRGPFALTVGVVTGYRRKHDEWTAGGQVQWWDSPGYGGVVAPLVSPSVRLPGVWGLTPRLSVVPGLGAGGLTVVHLSVERAI